MSNLVIIYDSKTGYTETMAKNIVDGTKSVEGVTVSLFKLDYTSSQNILENANIVALGSPSHNGFVTLEMLVFLASIKQAIDAGALKVDKKFGFAFGSYSWDGGICIDKLHEEMKKLGFKMVKKALAQINPIPDSSSEIQFLTE
jgi:flavorubredoxin